MNYKEIQDLIRLVNKLELTEFKLRDGEFELSVRTKRFEKNPQIVTTAAPVAAAPAQPVAPAPQSAAPVTDISSTSAPGTTEGGAAGDDDGSEAGLIPVKSPIVGTFYRSSAPDKPVYVKVGDTIEVGQVVCIVEAMKLFNEIESEVAGKIVKVVVEDASPVEYDQVLFMVDPKG